MGIDSGVSAAILTGVAAVIGSAVQVLQHISAAVDKTAEVCSALRSCVPPDGGGNSCQAELQVASESRLWLPIYAVSGFLIGAAAITIGLRTRTRERATTGAVRLTAPLRAASVAPAAPRTCAKIVHRQASRVSSLNSLTRLAEDGHKNARD